MAGTVNPNSMSELYATLNAKAQAGTNKTASEAASTQDRFLKLLVTQMKNQDPLNPMDNAQVTSQMAQLSTVSGVDKLNTTLQAMSDNMRASQNLQAASMIGHGVLTPGEGVQLSQGKGYGGVELAQSVDKLTVSIQDRNGLTVRKIELGAQPVGLVNWQWDGRNDAGTTVSDGDYTFTVSGNMGKDKIDVTGLQFGVVNSVTQGAQGVTLSVGQLEGVALSAVRKIV